MSSKRILKEWAQMEKTPLSYCSFELPHEDHIHTWRARLKAPAGTPYEKGTFIVEIEFPVQYPFKPPKFTFLTKLYHPNVKTNTGEICHDIINENWSPTLNVRHCVEVLHNMMADPGSEHPLEPSIATQYMEKPKDFEKMALKFTKEYAMGN